LYNCLIEDAQTKQWPKENVQKDKQRSTKHTHTTKAVEGDIWKGTEEIDVDAEKGCQNSPFFYPVNKF
jgi:hypothetical protein